ncbi:MAG: Methyltransferase type 12 [uncultured bacterium]|nr:MAG: Methyltransferase type 12 [uncultured bacterium]
MEELYESSYNKKNHFSFGQNWENYLSHLTDAKIARAKLSLVNFLGGKNKIKGKSFIDIGCGSGLFSLSAYLLKASKITSVDVDDFSIACTKYLKNKNSNPKNWAVIKGSALNPSFINSLGQFDIVYSWGVLHHSGNMYKAFDHVVKLVKISGVLYLAIYNDNEKIFEGTSKFWLKVKKVYNQSGILPKKIILYLYCAYYILGLLLQFKNPYLYIKNYQSNRGMNWLNDAIDWLGGYPYEYASPETIRNYFNKLGFVCKKVTKARSIACNEYLFVNK